MIKGMGRPPTLVLCSRNRGGDGADDLLCSRNAPGFVCLVGGSFWSVWFFWMNFRSDQPDRRDRPDEPAFVGRAQWKINQPPSLKRYRASLEGAFISFDARTRGSTRLLLKKKRGIGKTRAVGIIPPTPYKVTARCGLSSTLGAPRTIAQPEFQRGNTCRK